MQLLDSEQLEFALQAHGITLEGEARKFYTDVWNIIQDGEKVRHAHELTPLTASLRHLCDVYFSRAREWRMEEADRFEGAFCCDAARRNIQTAIIYLPDFEKHFFRYALCYLELNRALIHNRVQLSSLARDCNIDDLPVTPDITPSTGIILNRLHKERHELMNKRLHMEHVRSLLQKFDEPLEYLGAHLPGVYGQVEGDRQLTLFKGNLRKQNFAAARDVSKKWKKEELREKALTLIDLSSTHAKDLMVQGSLMLHSGELSLILMFLKGDEDRINVSIDKYNMPYMMFQYRNLLRQGYQLGRVGSIEGLIIQHAKLTALAARPHADSDWARTQEKSILIPAKLTLDQNFRSLSAIFGDVETICTILEKLYVQTKNYLRNATPVS